MSRNLEIIQSLYAAFDKGDVATLLGMLHEDVRWEEGFPAEYGIPWIQPLRGRAAVPRFFEALFQHAEIERLAPIDLLVGRGRVLALMDLRLRVKATGKIIEDMVGHLWTLDDAGLVTGYRHLIDTHRFMQALTP